MATATPFTSLSELKNALHDTTPSLPEQTGPDDNSPVLKLFLVEDISGDVVELFGSRYRVDPTFFESHVAEHSWLEVGKLLTSITRRQWSQIQNPILREFQTTQTTNKFLQSRQSNVARHNRYVPESYDPTSPTHFTTPGVKTTIWIGQDDLCPNTTIGIVLLDPVRYVGAGVITDRDACVATSAWENVHTTSHTRAQGTWYDDIVEMTVRNPWSEAVCVPSIMKDILIMCPSFYTACAEWLVVCSFATKNLVDIEKDLAVKEANITRETQIDKILNQLRRWRSSLRRWRELVNDTLDQGIITAKELTRLDQPNPLDELIPDYKRVLHKLDELGARADEIFDRATAEMQLAAARQSLAESHDLARLSWLATIFIPLTFMTGLFSMNEDIGAMKSTFKIYFEAAMPIAAVALVIAGWGSIMVHKLRIVTQHVIGDWKKLKARIRGREIEEVVDDHICHHH